MQNGPQCSASAKPGLSRLPQPGALPASPSIGVPSPGRPCPGTSFQSGQAAHAQCHERIVGAQAGPPPGRPSPHTPSAAAPASLHSHDQDIDTSTRPFCRWHLPRQVSNFQCLARAKLCIYCPCSWGAPERKPTTSLAPSCTPGRNLPRQAWLRIQAPVVALSARHSS